MLAEHPSLLSVFEFFTGLDMSRRFSNDPIDGAAFAHLISQEHPFVTMVLSRGYEVQEITYPFGPGARYQREQGLPWILVSTLPRFTDDPDALFEETVAWAAEQPRQHLARHYRSLFEWLAGRFGKSCWLERSGSSIDYLGGLHAFFPDARFVHLHRDGHETALSMREHAAYRLAISFVYQLQAGPEPSIDELRTLEAGRADDAADPIARVLASRPPVDYFGRYWSQELTNGYRAVSELDAAQYMEVRFEELVAQPGATLARIAGFFELESGGGWIDRAAALVRGLPPTRFQTLTPEEQERLAEACRPGMELLGRV